ncbi:hypothetical protein CR513_09315, partial [Mucuna pruriens]
MSRSRLLWFTFGFTSTYAVFSQCVLKDLLVERLSLTSHMENEFRALEARLSNIQSSLPNRSSSIPAPTPDQLQELELLTLSLEPGSGCGLGYFVSKVEQTELLSLAGSFLAGAAFGAPSFTSFVSAVAKKL